MRRILAAGCCALFLSSGFAAGTAHVHESADRHEELRGLHLDHAHLDDSGAHDHRQGHESPHEGEAPNEAGHVGRPDEDVLYLTVMALRSFESSQRAMPATVSVGETIDPPPTMWNRDEAMPCRPRDPPRKSTTRPRAPPA